MADERGDPITGVVIGLPEIWRGVEQIKQSTASTDAKLQQILDHLDTHSKQLDDHEQRIRGLERARWPIPAATAVLAVIATIAAVWTAIQGN